MTGGGEAPAALGERAPTLRFSVDVSGARGVVGVFGGVTDPSRGMVSVALRAQLPLVERPTFRLDYTGGLVPVELAQGTRVPAPGPFLAPVSETVYGAGLDIVGLMARFRGSSWWHPFLTARGGFRVFTASVPNPRGTPFNFSADVGGGVALRAGPGHWLILRLELHHLSNGGLGAANPSLNQLSVGIGLEGPRKGGVRRRS